MKKATPHSLAAILVFLLVVFALAGIRPAGASFWQSCMITADVTAVATLMGQPELGLTITEADTMGGSHAGCETMLGQHMTAVISDVPKGVEFAKGDSVTLDYTYYNAMGEDGVINDQTWKFVEKLD